MSSYANVIEEEKDVMSRLPSLLQGSVASLDLNGAHSWISMET